MRSWIQKYFCIYIGDGKWKQFTVDIVVVVAASMNWDAVYGYNEVFIATIWLII